MLELLTDRGGWPFAVIKGDDHQTVWAKQRQSLTTDQTVPDSILPRIKYGATVVDAGANVGSHTVEYAVKVGPSGTVHAFEPYLEAYCCLAFNTRDFPHVHLHHCGLAESKYRVKMQTEINAGATHIIPKHSKDMFHELPAADVIALDSLMLPQLDFLKVDVEGYEPLLIRGALETIKRCRPIIFIELNKGALALHGFGRAAVLQPLTELGYRVEFIDKQHTLDMDQVDIFLMP